MAESHVEDTLYVVSVRLHFVLLLIIRSEIYVKYIELLPKRHNIHTVHSLMEN